jgi:hypothetical protein
MRRLSLASIYPELRRVCPELRGTGSELQRAAALPLASPSTRRLSRSLPASRQSEVRSPLALKFSSFFSRHSPLTTRHGSWPVFSCYRLALTQKALTPTSKKFAVKFLKIFKNFQANSFICRVFNFYPGGRGSIHLANSPTRSFAAFPQAYYFPHIEMPITSIIPSLTRIGVGGGIRSSE